jgi:AraC-like DNA-binding protein
MTIETVLESLEIRMEPFALCDIHGQCVMGLAPDPHAMLHYVVAGEGEVRVGRAAPVALAPGSVILAPPFARQTFAAQCACGFPLPRCRPVEAGLEHVEIGEAMPGQGVLRALCGQLSLAYRGAAGINLLRAPIIETLPPGDRVRVALDELVAELSHPGIGTRALARALLEQCVILLLRRRLRAGDPALSWMAGIADDALWRPVLRMLDDPAAPHTVESLADDAGLSRAAFAARFSAVFGIGPAEMLRGIRLRRAADLLTRGSLPVKRVALDVGYRSRTYFTRAFEAEFGVAPGVFRATKQKPQTGFAQSHSD